MLRTTSLRHDQVGQVALDDGKSLLNRERLVKGRGTPVAKSKRAVEHRVDRGEHDGKNRNGDQDLDQGESSRVPAFGGDRVIMSTRAYQCAQAHVVIVALCRVNDSNGHEVHRVFRPRFRSDRQRYCTVPS